MDDKKQHWIKLSKESYVEDQLGQAKKTTEMVV